MESPFPADLDTLLASPSFQRWAAGTATPDEAAAWAAWSAADPRQAALARQGRATLRGLGFADVAVDVEGAWERLQPRLAPHRRPADRPSRPGTRHGRRRWLAPALALLVAVVGAGLWLSQRWTPGHAPERAQITTDYGEIKRVRLPDGSQVRLAPRSHLFYPADGFAADTRDVLLDGEAYFDVVPSQVPFRVRTSDGTVRVLGTTFTVAEREQGTRVVLRTGRVQVAVRGTEAQVAMTPGDLVEIHANEAVYTQRRVNPEVYASWTTATLVFDQTPIRDILEQVAATYGYTLAVTDATVLRRTFSGSIENYNVPVLLLALSRATGRDLYLDGRTIRQR